MSVTVILAGLALVLAVIGVIKEQPVTALSAGLLAVALLLKAT